MITVLVLAAVTAVIASGFLFRSAQEAKLATRALFDSVALNLAEAGVEEGLFAANTSVFNSANGWALATSSTTDYVKTITGFNYQQATGTIYIRVQDATTYSPVVIAAGVITIPNQPKLLKQLRIGASKRRLWANGVVTTGTLTFSGNNAIDSYNSSLGVYNSVTNRSDLATVATTSTALDTLVVGSNASIYGYVATGGASPDVGIGGRVYGATTPSGTLVDSSRIRTDFTANLPDVTAPTGAAISLGSVSSTTSLPRVGDTVGANGRYLYTASGVSLAGADVIAILGPVDIIVTGNISVSGNSQMSVGGTGSTNPSLNLYCPGSIHMGGNGMVNNTNTPAKSAIWSTGTSSSTQSVTIAGNGAFTGTIYAPNADVSLTGNGATNGAIIAKTSTFGGNGLFHYDVQLGQNNTTLDTSYRVTAWAELTKTPTGGDAFARDNRAPFDTLF